MAQVEAVESYSVRLPLTEVEQRLLKVAAINADMTIGELVVAMLRRTCLKVKQ